MFDTDLSFQIPRLKVDMRMLQSQNAIIDTLTADLATHSWKNYDFPLQPKTASYDIPPQPKKAWAPEGWKVSCDCLGSCTDHQK